MPLPSDFILKSFYPPGIVQIRGKTYACPGWVEIPEDTTIEELLSRWKKSFEGINSNKLLEKRIQSSDGKREYIISHKENTWSCTCIGFKYHRRCRHIDSVKEQSKNL